MNSSIFNRSTIIDRTDRAGFTLVEIMVAVAILAIMAGVMVPMVHKVWESSEKSETRQKMMELKRAMVGDQNMYQNGIRMHYGFVGDNGVLPITINDLVSNSGAFVNWNGPYLVGAFDPNDYSLDAWGRGLVYELHDPPLTVGGQLLSATLTSLGPDGLADTSDDLDENSDPTLQILVSEVWPTARVQGNLDYVFTAAATTTPSLWANIRAFHKSPDGSGDYSSACFSVNVGLVEAGIAKSVRQAFTADLSGFLSVGPVTLESWLYNDSVCENPVGNTNPLTVYVSDSLPAVSVNFPTLDIDL